MRNVSVPGAEAKSALRSAFIVILGLAISVLGSCVKEKYDFDKISGIEWGPEFAVPLVHSKLTLDDILREVNPGDLLITDSITSTLKIVYKGQVFSQNAAELFPQLDQVYDSSFQVLMPPLPAGDSIQVSLPITLTFNTSNGEIMDSLWYDEGDFRISISSNLNRNIKLRLQIPGLKKNSSSFDVILPYQYTGITPLTVTRNEDLKGYSCIFNSATAGIHYLGGILTATIYGDNNPNNSPYSLDVSLKQENLKMAGLFGYLGQQTINLPLDTVVLGLFKSSLGGNFSVDDPRLKISFTNSFGIPIAIDVTTLEAQSASNPANVLQLSGPGLPKPFFINAPAMSQLGQSITTNLFLNKSNSNIDDMINLLPSEIHYAMEATMNPSGNTVNNFVLKDSKMDIDLDVEVPLSGTASGFQLQDTIDFSFDKIDQLESIMFKINILNSFPLDVELQVYFADSAFTVIDSLLQPMERLIVSGIPGPPPDYKVTVPSRKITEVALDQNRLANLYQTKNLILKATLATSNNGTTTVKIYADYYVDVKLGTKAKLKLTSN